MAESEYCFQRQVRPGDRFKTAAGKFASIIHVLFGQHKLVVAGIIEDIGIELWDGTGQATFGGEGNNLVCPPVKFAGTDSD